MFVGLHGVWSPRTSPFAQPIPRNCQMFWDICVYSVSAVMGDTTVSINQSASTPVLYMKSWLFDYRCDSDVVVCVSQFQIRKPRIILPVTMHIGAFGTGVWQRLPVTKL